MGTHPIFESDFDCLTEMALLRRLIGRGCLLRRVSVLGRDFADDEMTNLTERIIRNVDSKKHLIQRHPVQIIKQQIYDFFDGEYRTTQFEKVDNISPIVSVAQNFDSVLIPRDHVSRSKNDNYYINKEFMLRAHTSAHQVDLLKQGKHCFLCTGDVYRRDTIDKSHYPIFHQMEGVRLFTQEELESVKKSRVKLQGRWNVTDNRTHRVELFEPADANSNRTEEKQEMHSAEAAMLVENDLKVTLECLVRHLFGEDAQFRWNSEYFPFTHPSWEIEVFYEGDWLEVLGCGIIEHKVLQNGQIVDKMGWAFGLGLERLAMRLFDISDIRLFWNKSEAISAQFGSFSGDFRAFKFATPVRKADPTPFDVAFWIPPGFSENDLYDIVRNCDDEDSIEDVKQIDVFTHPKSGKTSHCYRISYRGLLKGLQYKDVEHIDGRIRDELARIGAELR